MSRRGNCYDNEVPVKANARSALYRNCNAPMESFRGLPKNELAHHRRFKTRAEAIQAVSEYIEIFYRRQRKQARLSYLSPAAFERQFYENRLVV